MDTHQHHQVLQQGAAPRIERAFAETGVERFNVNALFLGNWLADLSQVNDPGSTLVTQFARDLQQNSERHAAVAAQISTKIATAFTAAATGSGAGRGGRANGGPGSDAASGTGGAGGGGRAGAGTKPPPFDAVVLGKLSKRIRERVEELLGAVVKSFAGGGDSELFQDVIRLVRVCGYLKFARPESHKKGLEISYDSYARIFAELCRQYFPHEHLDRPLCSASYGDNCEAAWGPQYAAQDYRDRLYAVARESAAGDAHLYSYLVDDRTILAGRFAELDLGWASVDLVSGTSLAADERDLWLARLGHTLHGVEDFFAHSTFTEKAIFTARGEQGIDDAIRSRTVRRVGEPVESRIASDKVERRFQRYTPDLYEPGSGPSQPEDAVVTGYFDGWDTLNSVLHIAEELVRPELFGFESRKRQSALEVTIRELVTEYGEETVGPVLDLLKVKPLTTPGSREQRVHQALDGLMDYIEKATAQGEAASHVPSLVEGYAKRDPVLRYLPEPLVREDLAPAVLGLTRVFKGLKIEWTVYKAIKALAEFEKDPVAYLLKPLIKDGPENLLEVYVRVLAELIGKDLLVGLNYVVLSELQDLFRATRVGCHSLLAKDQPTEPLFDEMFTCARHTDWLLVDTLCRWSDSEWVKAAPADSRWVRWDELLAFFLRSPVDVPAAPRRRISWRHAQASRSRLVQGDGETLRSAYQALVATADGVQQVGTYDEFLAANLGAAHLSDILVSSPVAGFVLDERRVTELIVASGLATAGPGGHSLLPGVRLVLPVWVDVKVDVVETVTWFGDVIDLMQKDRAEQKDRQGEPTPSKWLEAALSYEASRLNTSPPAFSHYTMTYHRGPSDAAKESVKQFVAAAASVRQNLELAYPHR